MFMHELYQRERHTDFVREAEQDRLKAQDKKAKKPSKFAKRIYKPAVAKIGKTMVNVGTCLQDNMETVTPAQIRTANERA